MAEALGCALADNSALDSMSFRGDTEQDAIDSLAREFDLHMQPWTGTGVPWMLGDQMTTVVNSIPRPAPSKQC